jgi:plastocyanin
MGSSTAPAPTGNVTTGNVTGGSETATGKATGDNETATAADETNSFIARGQVASTISDDLLGGKWKIDVIDGNVERVQINMTMAKQDGSDFHTLLIDNFTAGAATNDTGATGDNMTTGNETTLTFPQIVIGGNESDAAGNETGSNLTAPTGNVTAPGNESTTAGAVSVSQDGTFEISGTANIYMNNEVQWENIPITIEGTGRVLIVDVDHEMTDNHFGGEQIYGFVTALIGGVDGGKQSFLPQLETDGAVTPPAPTGPTLPNATAPSNETTGSQIPPAPTASQGGAGGTEVSITSGSSSKTTDAYDTNPIQISVGDTVTWTNDDSTPHTVTSGSNGQPDGMFDSSPNLNPLMAPGDTFEHTFEETGEFPYYCAVHPNMEGTVSVS